MTNNCKKKNNTIMRRRKILTGLLCSMAAIAMVSVGTVPVKVFAEEQELVETKKKYFDNNNIGYTVIDGSNVEVDSYLGTDSKVIIPSTASYVNTATGKVSIFTVTGIGEKAFESNKTLEFVHIPNTVTYFERGAFAGCTNLQYIVFNGGVEKAGEVIFPENIEKIGENSFAGCSSLESIIIPANTIVEDWAFSRCSNLVSVNMLGTKIADWAFNKCTKLENLVLGENLQEIGIDAFHGCTSLKHVVIPAGVTVLGKNAFVECSSLESVIIPDGVTSMECTFMKCTKLTNVKMPAGIKELSYTFSGCTSLKNIVLPDGITVIGDHAFHNCSALEEIVIPESVTTIGRLAFVDCDALTEIILPDSVTEIKYAAFRECDELTSITLPKNLETIPGEMCFICSKLKTIIWPEKLKTISSSAFNRCTSIEEIILPEGLTKIDTDAFRLCSSVKMMVIPSTVTTFIDEYDYYGSSSFTGVLGVYKDSYGLTFARSKESCKYKILDMKFSLDSKEQIIGKGQKVQLTATSDVADEEILWTTSDESVAMVDENGLVTGVKEGNAVITVSCGGNELQCNIFVQKPADEELIRAFASRLYSLVLGREGDSDGLTAWSKLLATRESSGVDAGYGFVFSPECIERNLSDDAFVEMLYNTFMNRPSDEGGKSAWVSQLENGVSREKILEGFIMSQEFSGICAEYGIAVGTVSNVAAFEESLEEYRNQNSDVTAFVARCYTQALSRGFDDEGLNAWCRVILTQENTPTDVAKNFIFSDEFLGKNLDDAEYIKVLYRTFMGREADEDGLNSWLAVLKSGAEDREKVLEGFANSLEFAEILASFGLSE